MMTLIIIPAYNESENIKSLLEDVKALDVHYDVIVVNDASEDNTSDIAKGMGVSVIDLPINLGIGGAMQTGYLYAYYNHYDIAIQVDGDGQHDPNYIAQLVDPILKGESDMVIGSRFINYSGFQSTILRRLGIRYFEKLIFILTGKKFSDPTSGFRACNKEIISHFIRYYPFDYPEPETLVAIHRKGYKLEEVPVKMKSREGGQSSIQSFKILYYMLKVTLAIMIDVLKNKGERYLNDGTQVTVVPNSD